MQFNAIKRFINDLSCVCVFFFLVSVAIFLKSIYGSSVTSECQLLIMNTNYKQVHSLINKIIEFECSFFSNLPWTVKLRWSALIFHNNINGIWTNTDCGEKNFRLLSHSNTNTILFSVGLIWMNGPPQLHQCLIIFLCVFNPLKLNNFRLAVS